MFEELTRQFLLNDARFAHQFKEVYLWSEWPGRQTGDTGIDLVAIPAKENAGQAQEPRFGRGLRRGSRADASPGPHRPEHAPAPSQGGRGPVAHEDHCARQWDQGALDRVWITDFTYLRCAQGWVYLCGRVSVRLCTGTDLQVCGEPVGVGHG